MAPATIDAEFSKAEPAIAEAEMMIDKPGDAHAGAALILREDLRWVPSRVSLGSLRRATLRVLSPFDVAVRAEGESIIAEATEISELGFGTNLSDALADLQATIVELYETLEREQPSRLGPDLLHIRSVLRQKVERRG